MQMLYFTTKKWLTLVHIVYYCVFILVIHKWRKFLFFFLISYSMHKIKILTFPDHNFLIGISLDEKNFDCND